MRSSKFAVLFFALAMLTLSIVAVEVLSPTWVQRAEARPKPTMTETPKYEVLGALDAAGLRKVEVSTSAKTEAGMRLVAEDLRDENLPENGTLLVEFDKPRDTSVDTGFALVFDNERAALDAGRGETSVDYDEAYSRKEARRILKDEDGMRVVSFEEFADENPGVWEEYRRLLR